MARPIECDLCKSEDAIILQSYLNEGQTVGVGANCLPGYLIGLMQAFGLVPEGWLPPTPDAPAETPAEAPVDADPASESSERPKRRQRAAETPA